MVLTEQELNLSNAVTVSQAGLRAIEAGSAEIDLSLFAKCGLIRSGSHAFMATSRPNATTHFELYRCACKFAKLDCFIRLARFLPNGSARLCRATLNLSIQLP